MSLDVISFLELNFEDIKPVTSRDDLYIVSPCPICGRKNKLYVNVASKVFYCQRCNYGKGLHINKLFEDMGATIKDYFIDDGVDDKYYKAPKKQTLEIVKTLPVEYNYIIGNNSQKAIIAYNFLRNRGIGDALIAEYNMGYCSSGKYNNRIVIPYYEKNNLVYYVARDFTGNQIPKYLNAPWDKTSFLFNYERVNTKSNLDFIVIVEGVMDVMSMPDNSVCLLGKFISPIQKELLKKYEKIYVALDSDALDNEYELCKELYDIHSGSNKIFVVEIPEGEDPSSCKDFMWELIKQAKPYTPISKFLFELQNMQVL